MTTWAKRSSDWIGALFMRRLVASPRGRAFMLGFMANAEESDEGAFDALLADVADETVVKMIERHSEDEKGHARVLKECLARTPAAPTALPIDLAYIDRLDRATGGDFRKGWLEREGRTGIAKIYALLQVVEERGVEQFRVVADSLRPVDPESAAVVDRIVKDEERHVRYARAIALRYSESEAAYLKLLESMRELEARAFAVHGSDFLRFVLDRDLLQTNRVERWFWRALVNFGPRAAHPTVSPASTATALS